VLPLILPAFRPVAVQAASTVLASRRSRFFVSPPNLPCLFRLEDTTECSTAATGKPPSTLPLMAGQMLSQSSRGTQLPFKTSRSNTTGRRIRRPIHFSSVCLTRSRFDWRFMLMPTCPAWAPARVSTKLTVCWNPQPGAPRDRFGASVRASQHWQIVVRAQPMRTPRLGRQAQSMLCRGSTARVKPCPIPRLHVRLSAATDTHVTTNERPDSSDTASGFGGGRWRSMGRQALR
jgi:hypothetical protein